MKKVFLCLVLLSLVAAGCDAVTSTPIAPVAPAPSVTPPVIVPPAPKTVVPPVAAPPPAGRTTPPTINLPEQAPPPVIKKQSSNCDPNYSGCVPVASDVDCAGGSGNGPAYARGPIIVTGSDIYGLDRDGDGVACE